MSRAPAEAVSLEARGVPGDGEIGEGVVASREEMLGGEAPSEPAVLDGARGRLGAGGAPGGEDDRRVGLLEAGGRAGADGGEEAIVGAGQVVGRIGVEGAAPVGGALGEAADAGEQLALVAVEAVGVEDEGDPADGFDGMLRDGGGLGRKRLPMSFWPACGRGRAPSQM